jgi:hypothetical protein
MTRRFLSRPPPLEGESLSSWRQRGGWRNAYALFPIEAGRLRRCDPDRGIDAAEARWLEQGFGVSTQTVERLSLAGCTTMFSSELTSRRHPPWWIRSRYGNRADCHGAMFCPECLKESEPYFRLQWRFGFHTCCVKHRIVLLDSCPECGAAPWPAACAVESRLHPAFISLRQCWRCGANLSCAPSEAANPACMDIVRAPPVRSDRWPLREALLALRALCHLFVRAPVRALILNGGAFSAAAAQQVATQPAENAIEHYPVHVRQAVIAAARELMLDWPERFVAFAGQCNITRAYFCGSRQLHPLWFEAVVNEHLARQNRWVSQCDVRNVACELASCGLKPTRVAIRRVLKWQGDIPSEWLLQRRHREAARVIS